MRDGSIVPYYTVRAGHSNLTSHVSTVRPLVLLPNSVSTYWCKVRHHIRSGTDGLFEPSNQQCANSIFISPSLGRVRPAHDVPVQFMNLRNRTVKIYPATLGTFTVLDTRVEVATLFSESEFQVKRGNLPCDSD